MMLQFKTFTLDGRRCLFVNVARHGADRVMQFVKFLEA